MALGIGRRQFVSVLLGGAAVGWPFAARAQRPTLPVIGYLSATSSDANPGSLEAFREGLKVADFVEGQNVTIEYRWANNESDRLSELAADLTRRKVGVIVAPDSTLAVQAAQTTTATIPIVFRIGTDPIKEGFVASLNRPGGNLTGLTTLGVELMPKRLELLREIKPTASIIALLVNPTNPAIAEASAAELQAKVGALGVQLHVLRASTEREIEQVFTNLAQLRADGLVIATDAFFNNRNEQLASLGLRYAMPAIYQFREFAAAGGLMSYGGSIPEIYRLVGAYTGRILKGEKPADLPVQQLTKVELIINLKTAKALGLTVPLPLLGRADEVIE
jgi:putative tryptophan/tyrosine transport system substrate-binding protein